MIASLAQDLAYAARGFARRPGFTVVVAATLALGIGANAAIFSVVNGILLRPLPYPEADRVVSFGHEPPQWLTSEPDFLDYHREIRSLDGLAAYTRFEVTLTARGEPERLRMARASEDFFPVLGVPPLIGRTFAPDEYRPNPPTTVVLSYGLWQRRFGGDPAIVGRTLSLEGLARTVVGVMPPRFDFPEARTDLWSPLPRFNPDSLGGRANHFLFMVGRIRKGGSIERVRADARTVAGRIMRDYPQLFDPRHPLVPHLVPVGDELVGSSRPYLIALLGAVGLVLLIACANVANLLLVRGESRRKEMALRSALGATGTRLARQLLAETILLAIVGGALGLALAWGAERGLLAVAPSSLPRVGEIGMDWGVVAFTFITSAMTGIVIGLVPAWRATRGTFAEALKEGGKTTTAHGSARGARQALVVAEVALAVVVLSGAGMLLRSLWNLQRADLGFDPHGVLTAKVSIGREYDDARAALFYDQLLQRVRSLPGVRTAGAARWLPVVDAGGLWGFDPEGRSYPPGQGPQAVPQTITPGQLAAFGMPVRSGRDFTAADREGAPYVAIVSAALVKAIWPNENPLGKRFRLSRDTPWMTVVGVVGDIRARGFDDTPEPTMYFPYAQSARAAYFAPRAMSLLVRVSGDPASMAAGVVGAVRALDPLAPVSEIQTLEQVVATSVANRRFSTSLLAAFAALALLLAGIGTYGVIAYGVSQRTFEIGVRMALGAERHSVLMLVMGEGLRLCLIGAAIGVAGAIAVGSAIRAMLVGVPVIDLPTLGLVSVLLAVVAVVASMLPARRATRVSPTEALRG